MITQGRGLWEALFTRTQRQVLSLLYGYPERSFYANEIVRRAGVGTGSVQRELKKLVGAGLLSISDIGNQKHYRANRACPIFGELRSIVMKTFGALDQLRSGVRGLSSDIELALLYGEGSAEGVDLLIVSDSLEYADVVSGLTSTENKIGRSINPLVFSREEYARLRDQRDDRLETILSQSGVVLSETFE